MLAETVLRQVGGCELHSAHRPRTWRQGGGAGAQGHFLRGDEGVGSQWLLFLIRHSTGLSREQGVNGMDRV